MIDGPGKITIPEALKRYCAALHPEIRKIKGIPYPIAKLTGFFMRSKEFKFPVGIFEYFEIHQEEGDPSETNRLSGNPATTLDDFIKRKLQ